MEGFRNFAPSYVDGQDRNTPVTKHHETTKYKRLRGEVSYTRTFTANGTERSVPVFDVPRKELEVPTE